MDCIPVSRFDVQSDHERVQNFRRSVYSSFNFLDLGILFYYVAFKRSSAESARSEPSRRRRSRGHSNCSANRYRRTATMQVCVRAARARKGECHRIWCDKKVLLGLIVLAWQGRNRHGDHRSGPAAMILFYSRHATVLPHRLHAQRPRLAFTLGALLWKEQQWLPY